MMMMTTMMMIMMMMIINFSPLMDLSLSLSMFSQQQASPQFSQQSGGNMYNGNGMNLNSVSMAPNLATSSMGQMAGQMSVTSMASGPSPGLPAMGQEQVSTDVVVFLISVEEIRLPSIPPTFREELNFLFI